MANLLLVKDTTWNESLVSDGQVAFIAQDTDEGKNILFAQGEYFGDSAQANKVSIKEKITVAGGPLAESVSEVYPDGIPEGTTLQEILVSLLCKEVFPEVTVTTGSVTLNKASITFNSVPSGFVEVGAKGTVTATPGITGFTSKNSMISGLTYGYDLLGVKYDETSISAIPVVVTEGTQEFTLTSASFVDANGNDIADSIKVTAIQAVTNGVITKFGENKVSATLTNKSANYTIDDISDIYPYSNLGNKGETSYNISYINVDLDSPGNTTSSKTWTGAYPVFFNGVEYSDSNADGAEIATTSVANDIALTKCTTLNTSITKYIKFPDQAASNGWKIAIPDAYANSTITAKGFNASSGKYDINTTFTKGSTTGSGTCGVNTTFSYTLYECKGTDGANGLNVTITLK